MNSKPKETLSDLNSVLFEVIERLGNEDLTEEELDMEMRRAGAIVGVATKVIEKADLILRAAKFRDDKMDANNTLPVLLGE